MEPSHSDRSFARVVAARYDDPLREPRRSDAEIVRDVLWLITSRDADEREMGLYVLSLGGPTLIAELYPRLRGNGLALDELARLVHAEVQLLERSDDDWASFDRALREQSSLREAFQGQVRDELAYRRRWADALFAALDPADGEDLHARVKQVERRALAGAYAKRR